MKDENDLQIMGVGLHWNDVEVGDRFRTLGRTISDADITMFIGAVGMVEEMSANVEYIKEVSVIGSRPAPGSLIFCIAEDLLMQSTMQRTGMAFLEARSRRQGPQADHDRRHDPCRVRGRGGTRYEQGRQGRQPARGGSSHHPLRMVKTRPAA
ncbi:acyl dehydratase [Ramlibacter sp. H39-3-26]|uniref:acyl dehydratase n=1 Tax=Curvibacter soli TaxID=3031331 RepID=UPI0023D9EF19|nr:acyl dehydratase [Ramlibacter sp. H39-3-26]MDF1483776.1 acyl dehydratase [Ramlibacter sp. H39-3-26]